MNKILLVILVVFNTYWYSTLDWDDVGIVPLTDAGGITQEFKSGEHYGIDIAWHKQHNCDVLAWQYGRVIKTGYFSDTGYYVVLEHSYQNSKRWTVYIHLTSNITVHEGQIVYMGQTIGYRGNTGRSHGEHLHFYLTKKMDQRIPFTFNTLKRLAVDPVPYLYYLKDFNTVYISKDWAQEWPNYQEIQEQAMDMIYQ